MITSTSCRPTPLLFPGGTAGVNNGARRGATGGLRRMCATIKLVEMIRAGMVAAAAAAVVVV
ncbi:unnamed protein product [Ectocarpus sp. CCAP 1310/34]|nr:unnamed protein product [Ectocarpus sp. CCAP 1310/34]